MSDEADIEAEDEVSSALISPDMWKILDGMTPLTRRNRIELIQKVADGTAQLWQINLLKADGILTLPEPLETNVSDDIICDTMELLAARMKKHYQNPDGTSRIDIDIDKGTISDWCNLRRLDAGQHPPPRAIARRAAQCRDLWRSARDRHRRDRCDGGGRRDLIATSL